MTRRRLYAGDTREPHIGRVAQWKRHMANRVALPGGEWLDMDDPVAIRAHAMKTIAAISTESNGFNQTRLAAADRLLELADAMEKTQKPATGPISLEQARAASAELLRRKAGG